MILISLSAAEHLRSMLEEPPSEAVPSAGEVEHDRGLRIFVEKGGCAGMQYGMRLDRFQQGDVVSERDGVRVFVDPLSGSYLEGSALDYCDDLVGTGFRLTNPNATRSCGCGTSFEPSEAERKAASSVEHH